MIRATVPGSIIARLLPAASMLGLARMLLEDLLFELLDVVEPRRPLVLPQTHYAAQHLGDALEGEQARAERNQHLERPDRHARGAVHAGFADPHRFKAVTPARQHERQHPREEEDDVQHQLHHRLRPRAPQPVEHVGPHVAAARERVGAGHVEHRAVHEVAHVERPGCGVVQDVAHEHLVRGAEGEDDQAPCEGVPDRPAQEVYAVDESVDHRLSRMGRKMGRRSTHRPSPSDSPRAPAQAGTLVLKTCS